MMKPPIMTLLPLSTRTRVETLSSILVGVGAITGGGVGEALDPAWRSDSATALRSVRRCVASWCRSGQRRGRDAREPGLRETNRLIFTVGQY